MKRPAAFRLIPFLLAALAAAGLSSCMVYEEGYYADGPRYAWPTYAAGGGGYGGDGHVYDDWGSDYYGYYPPVYRSYVTYSASWPYYYGGRYYSYRWWDDHRYRGYCYDYGSNWNKYRKRRSSEEMKLVRYHGPDRGRLPTGYHSEKWYRDRGYSLKTNTYRERDGDLRGRKPSSSSSSSSSSSARKKQDSRPTSEHPRAIRQPENWRYVGSAASKEADRRKSSSSSGGGSRASTSRSDDRRPSSSSNKSTQSRQSASPSRPSSQGSSGRTTARDTRPTSEHPRALRQPEKYRPTGGGGGGASKSGGGSGGGGKSGDKSSSSKGKKD